MQLFWLLLCAIFYIIFRSNPLFIEAYTIEAAVKIRIVDSIANVFSKPDLNSALITQLFVGNEAEVGSIVNKADRKWVAVRLPNGQRGYMPGETKIFRLRQVALLQGAVNAHSAPFENSSVTRQYKLNNRFFITDVVKQDGKNWVKIRDAAGNEGFIDGQSHLKQIISASKETGKKNMLRGSLWFIGGIVVTVGSLMLTSSGGTYIVSWGAIIFGGLQLLQGLYQYFTAPA